MAKKKRKLSVTQAIMRDVAKQLECKTHDLTRKTYLYHTKRFIQFCREQYDVHTYADCADKIQGYADFLTQSGKYTPSSIHLMLAACCAAFGVPLQNIKKPKRHTAEYTRGRTAPLNPRNSQNPDHERWERLVQFAKRVGIRKAEYYKLKKEDFLFLPGQNGLPDRYAVRVLRGKGGKSQNQIIMEDDVEFVKSYFDKLKPGQFLFPPELYKNNALNLHKYRSDHAREVYDMLLRKIQDNPAYEKVLEAELRARFAGTYLDKKTGSPKPFPEHLLRGAYVLRGKNRRKALEHGYATQYNKTVLLYVSVFLLSHFRLDVAAASYVAI